MQAYAAAGSAAGMSCGAAVDLAVVLARWLDSAEAMGLTHEQLETRVQVDGREILRLFVQGHLDERARREQRRVRVLGADGVARTRVERGHRRGLATVFGPVTVSRWAYRGLGVSNVYPGDEVLNLPAGLYSFGLRRQVVGQVVNGSFDTAVRVVAQATGVRVGKRQAQELTVAAAADVAGFYAARAAAAPAAAGDLLVLSVDGQGVVMLPAALTARTRRIAERATPKMLTQLGSGEKAGRKRMAGVGAVYDCTPVPRRPEEIITMPGRARLPPGPVPKAAGKWLTASLGGGIGDTVAAVFDQAQRRDPRGRRCWLVLVDGDHRQIEVIRRTAADRNRKIRILVDFVHVLEYLWKAARGFYTDGDRQAETWVAGHARDVLAGHAAHVAETIAAQAQAAGLGGTSRKLTDTAVGYLTNKADLLDYATALRKGWPIATGVVEGACRHLVKDRMDITGARWGLATAEAVLTLRAVAANGDLDEYWTYHLTQEHHRNHKSKYANETPPQTTH